MGVKLTINGIEIEARPGQKILEAAKDHGIKIPHLCYHGQIGPVGSCRICLVEVKPGPPKPVPACTTTVAEGMEVQTHSERVINLRRDLVALLLLNHPLDCPVCDKAGECKLQNICHELGIEEQKWRTTPASSRIDYDSPLIERHPERCIHCGRCVTICERIIGAEGIYFANRGYDVEVTGGGRPLGCEFCGSCVAVCPVGALIDKTFKYRARTWELTGHETTCPYCGGGCRLELNVAGNSVRRVTSNHKKTFNRGMLCGRGRFGHGFIGSPERLKAPLIRDGERLRAVGWEEAIGFAAEGLERVRSRHGSASVYALGSPRISCEANYLLQKFVRVGLGTHNIDTQARYGYLPALLALVEIFGPPRVAGGKLSGFSGRCGTLAELAGSDAVLVIGADVRPELPSAALSVIAAANRGAQLCVANLRPTKLDRFAGLRLRYAPGAEARLLAALGSQLEGNSCGELPRETGASAADIEALAGILAGAARPALVFGHDLFATGDAAGKIGALSSVLLALKDDARLYPLAPKANSRGAVEAGCCPEWLPGYRPLAEAGAFEKRWATSLGKGPGQSFPEAVAAGGLRALYCVGANPLRGWPNTAAIEEMLGGLEFLIVQDLFLTQTAATADVVLPAASFAAQDGGSFINSEGRRGRLAAAVAEAGLLPDWEIVARLATALECPMTYAGAAEVFSEMAGLAPILGLPFEELQALPREFSVGAEMPRAAASAGGGRRRSSYLLVAGSLFHSGTLTTRSAGPLSVEAEGAVLINAQDAAALDLRREVALEANGERLVAAFKVSGDLPRGLLVAPDHFASLPIHRLTAEGFMVKVKVSKP